MYPVLFHIGKLNFYTHGLLIAIGALAGGLIIYWLLKKNEMETAYLFDSLIYVIFFGIFGARLLYVILYWNQFNTWQEMLYIWQGGLTSFGGMLFGYLALLIILRKYRQNIGRWVDFGIIGFLAGWTFGRIGCFLTGDVLGITSSSKVAIFGRIPVTLFEAGWCLLVAAILLVLVLKNSRVATAYGSGFIFKFGLLLYSLGRFILDFWRDDRIIWHLRVSQFGTLILLLLSLVLVIMQLIKKSKNV